MGVAWNRAGGPATAASGVLLLMLGGLVMVGWLVPVPRLVQLVPGWVSMPFNAALVTVFFGLSLLGAWRPVRWVQVTAALLVFALSFATLLQYLFDADFGIDEFFVTDWLRSSSYYPGRMPASSAAATAFVGTVLALGARIDWRDGAGIAAWALGVVMVLAGFAVLLHLPTIEWVGWIGFKSMSFQGGIAALVGGVGLLGLSQRWRGDSVGDLWTRRQAMLVFLIVSAVGVNLWQALASVDLLRRAEQTAQAARSVELQLTSGRAERYSAFRRLRDRLDDSDGDRFTLDDWETDARSYLRDIASVRSLLVVDASGRIVRLVTRFQEQGAGDTVYAFDEQRRALLADALARGQLVISPPMQLRFGGTGFQMLMPLVHRGAPTAMIIGMAYDEVFGSIIGDAAPGYGISIDVGDQAVYTRGGPPPASTTPVETFSLSAPGGAWTIRVWPLAADGGAPQRMLPLVVLVLSLVSAFLVALAYRYSLIARAHLARMRQESAFSHALFRESNDVLCTTDADGRFVRVSDAARNVWGYEPSEMEGRVAFDFVDPADRASSERVSDEVSGGKPVRNFVNRMRRKDGSPVWVSWAGSWSDELGVNVAVARDVTAMVEHERRIADSEERLRVAVERTGRLVYDRPPGPGHRSVWVGDPRAMLGLTLDELVDMPDDVYWSRAHPADREPAEGAFRRAREAGGGFRVQYRWQRPNGTWVWLEDSGVVIDGRLVVVKTDVSEQREVEEQLERRVEQRTRELVNANRELESFSYSVSHDLRTPLRAISGFTELLREHYGERLDDDGRHWIARIEAGSQRMGMLIDDLLTLSQVSKRELDRQTVDLSVIAEGVLAGLREAHPGRSVEVRIEPGLTCRCDPRLAEVVLSNLLGNAWKFTRDRDPAVIEFVRHESGFRIGDNGVGFDMQYAGQLFGVFQRLHGIGEFPGTGIGLATVKRIIERHGGSVWTFSEEGKGANFFFNFGD